MIRRFIEDKIILRGGDGKAIIIMGARQVGKTTVLKNIFGARADVLWLNGDEVDVQSLFANVTSSRLRAIIGDKKIVIIDEAQRIENIGLKLKLITDNMSDIKLIATGSSSFDLASSVNEPLTGRKWEYKMYPVSFGEMVEHHGLLEEKRLIPHRLIYGYYPDVINNIGSEADILKQLSDSYLYKDIFQWERIKKSDKLIKLLQALAYQLGSQVSYNELGQMCGLDSKTVEKYIILLEQAYVIFRLSSFSNNKRNELKNSKKIYFYDNGIRNALISNFAQVESRADIGALWENFLISERIKKNSKDNADCNKWFWRTTTQREIDYIEELGNEIASYEFKWNTKSKAKPVLQFTKHYPEASFKVISPDNVDEFLL